MHYSDPSLWESPGTSSLFLVLLFLLWRGGGGEEWGGVAERSPSFTQTQWISFFYLLCVQQAEVIFREVPDMTKYFLPSSLVWAQNVGFGLSPLLTALCYASLQVDRSRKPEPLCVSAWCQKLFVHLDETRATATNADIRVNKTVRLPSLFFLSLLLTLPFDLLLSCVGVS